jgi:D-alanine-D-alanine ligase
MGGASSEREVSLMSGEAIAAALEKRGHSVTRADITPIWTEALDREGIDVVFIALHGDFGESGDVQRLCEERGLRYTGSGPMASMMGMDKVASKQIFKKAGLVTPEWVVIEEFTPIDEARSMLRDMGLPVVLKPISGGSSVDVFICHDEEDRKEALEELLDVYARAMVEKYIPGDEFTVGILGDEALPVINVVPGGSFYDYDSKYSDDAGTRYIMDHGLDLDVVAQLQFDALAAHRSLDCRDFSRIDFIRDENGIFQVLEINTIPGFTSHSLLPKAAAEAGVDFEELCDRIVAMAMSRKIETSLVLN